MNNCSAIILVNNCSGRARVIEMKKYRIVNKVRFTAFVTTLVLISVIAISGLFGFSDVSASGEQEYISYYVESGDTLWDIAKTYGPSDMNIKQFIYLIEKHNNTNANTLQAGQIIEIPVV